MVLGPGPIGLYATQLLKIRGARKVIVLGADCDKDRLEMALQLGADYVINNSVEDPIERIKEITNGDMLDYVHVLHFLLPTNLCKQPNACSLYDLQLEINVQDYK